MDAPTSFGAYVRSRRKSLDLTQEELALRVGCSPSAIRKIESDTRRPSRQIAALLIQHLEIPAGEQQAFMKAARGERRADDLGLRLSSGAAPAVLAARPKTALPLPLTSFVGRQPELSRLIQLLTQPDCQIVTILGPGGIGKTRLALQAVRQMDSHSGEAQPAFPDGTHFVSLAPIPSPDLLPSAIADAIGFTFYAASQPAGQLLNFLRQKELLLVLDNMEHLAAGAALLSEILQLSPGIKILATSRERLHLPGEWVFEIQGLPIPRQDQAEGLEENSSVALFLQTVRRALPGFALDEKNRADIVRICRLLDGMPLAIELAAAWARTLSCAEIAGEIERSLDFLTTTARGVPERHRSLRAAFDHSWKLLSDEEQGVMHTLSVFRGGFSREAAWQVAGASLPVLSALIDKSLLRRLEDGRFGLHELIRQHAAAHLEQEHEQYREARDRHSDFYLGLLQAKEADLRSERQKVAVNELKAEVDNLRPAWEWAVAQGRFAQLRATAQPVMLFLEVHNLFSEGETLFRRVVEAVTSGFCGREGHEDCSGVLAEMNAHRAWFLYRLGRMEEALDLLRDSIAFFRKREEPHSLVNVLWYGASAGWFAGEFEEASNWADEGLALSRELDIPWATANYMVYQGVIAHERGEYDRAYRLLDEALERSRQAGDPRLIAFAASFLSRTPRALEQPGRMAKLLEEIQGLAEETGDRYGKGVAQERRALLAQQNGSVEEASRLFHESIAVFREIGDPWSLSRALNHLGRYYLAQGNTGAAFDALREALHTACAARVYPNALDALAEIALLKAEAGSLETVVILVDRVLSHPSSTGEAKALARRLQAQAVAKLDPGRIQEILAVRQTEALEELIDE